MRSHNKFMYIVVALPLAISASAQTRVNDAIPCIQSICGTVEKAKTYSLLAQQLWDGDATDSARHSLLDALKNELVNASHDQMDLEMVVAERALRRPVVLDPTTTVIANYAFWLHYKDRIVFRNPQRLPDKWQNYPPNYDANETVNEPATRSHLSDLPTSEQDWLIRMASFWGSRCRSLGIVDDQSVSARSALKLQFSQHSYAAALAELSRESIQAKQAFQGSDVLDQIGFLSTPSEYVFMLIDRLTTQDIDDEVALRSLAEWYRFLTLFKGAAAVNRANPLRKRLTTKSDIIARQSKALSQRRKPFYAKHENFKEEIAKCVAFYNRTPSTFPSQTRLLQDFQEARSIVKTIATRLWPRAGMETALDSVEFVIPPRFETNLAELRRLQKSREKLLQSVGVLPAVIVLAKEEEWFPGRRNAICGDYMENASENLGLTSDITLDAVEIAGEEDSRRAVIEHELGHSVVRQLKLVDQAAYDDIICCLSAQHTEDRPTKGTELEEDFADMFAALLSEGARNPYCHLMTVDLTTKDYTDTSAVAGSEVDTDHSARLFRLLHYQFLMEREIPEACEAYLRRIRYTPNFRNCLEQRAR